ncbi:MAG: Rpn family recombination-promoting nuclease/putative transposase, partial [Bacteroidales bacterium]|nr:Rpn family recombination-promoting nuclease/putative transposase [Bacteroidales bacterium]
QFTEQKTFYERAMFNSTFVIQEQVKVGSTDWSLPQIYFIGVVNFPLHESSDRVLYRYRLKELTTGEDMPIPVEYIFLEVPNCRKAMTSEASLLDNFCYAMRNMPEMEERPKELQGEIFDLLFNSAEITKFAPKERSEYIKQMITIRDIVNQMATAEEKGLTKGIEQGIEQGRRDTIRKFMAAGASKELIAAATGLSTEEIEALQ